FCGACQRYFTIKDIHTFAKEYMLSWFPKLPSYQTFCKRLNVLQGAIVELTNQLFSSFSTYYG
ncbi:MAG: transposase, partial [Rikenellaceae bacterium]